MLETHIVMSSLISRLLLILMFCLILTLILRLVHLLMLCLISPMDLTIAHMVLVHERIALCLIVVIVTRVGMVFLLESLTLILSPNTWTVHAFPVVVLVPLVQMVKSKRL
jgi:hypothetical protein